MQSSATSATAAPIDPQTRLSIYAALTAAYEAGEINLVHSSADDRFAAVTILDDDTQTFREITTHPDCLTAVRALTRPDEGMVAEYMIDMYAPLDACVYPVSFDGDTPEIAETPEAFHPLTIPFA